MSAAESIPNFKPAAILYRGFEGRAVRKLFGDFCIGDVYLDRGFVTCSANYLTALQLLAFGGYGVLLEISLVAGQNLLPMDDWEIKGEYEYLLKRSSRYQITAIDRSAKVHFYAAQLLSADESDNPLEHECPGS